jgi:hypothetical protein
MLACDFIHHPRLLVVVQLTDGTGVAERSIDLNVTSRGDLTSAIARRGSTDQHPTLSAPYTSRGGPRPTEIFNREAMQERVGPRC